MADKLAVADWDVVPGNNDNIAGVPLVEGETYPGHINNALRAMMAQVKSKFDDAGAPPSSVAYLARSTAPLGWLKANGAVVSRTTYAALFAAIGTSYGAGDGSTTFALPDLRGEFVRGFDDGRGVDAGRTIASSQGAAIQSHNHTGTTAGSGAHNHTGTTAPAGAHTHNANTSNGAGNVFGSVARGSSVSVSDNGIGMSNPGDHFHNLTTTVDGQHTHNFTTDATGTANDTRPRNIALLACIKY